MNASRANIRAKALRYTQIVCVKPAGLTSNSYVAAQRDSGYQLDTRL